MTFIVPYAPRRTMGYRPRGTGRGGNYRRRAYVQRMAINPYMSRFPATTGKRYGPFSQSFQTKLRYAGHFSLNPALGATGVHTFKANDLYDPDNTGVGHQPYGFDELMAIYNHYTVLGAKATLTVASNSTIPFWIHLALRGDTSGGGTATEDLLEQPATKSTIVNVLDGGNNVKVLTHYFSAMKFFGKTKASIVGAADYRGNASSSPAELAYFRCFYSPNVSNDDLGLQQFHFQIEFDAVFTEPKMFTGS